MLRLAACLEEHYPHSMANAVVAEAKRHGLTHEAVSYTHLLSYDLKIRYICPDCREQEENNAEGGTQ